MDKINMGLTYFDQFIWGFKTIKFDSFNTDIKLTDLYIVHIFFNIDRITKIIKLNIGLWLRGNLPNDIWYNLVKSLFLFVEK